MLRKKNLQKVVVKTQVGVVEKCVAFLLDEFENLPKADFLAVGNYSVEKIASENTAAENAAQDIIASLIKKRERERKKDRQRQKEKEKQKGGI